jgi:DNA-binding XRE family transcriptional regulator
MTIPEAIREAREQAGLTQTELGELVGVTRMRVWAWETGRSETDWKTMVKLCHHLPLEFHFTAAGMSANTYVTP